MVQGVDYRIPMSVKTIDLAAIGDSYFQGVDDKRRNALLEISEAQNNRAQEVHSSNMSEAEAERNFKSFLDTSLRVDSLLESSPEDALSFLNGHISTLEAEGRNSEHSRQLRDAIASGNLEGAKALTSGVINTAERTGRLSSPSRALDEVGSTVEVMIDGRPMRAVPVTVNGETKLNILGPSTSRTPEQKIQDKVLEQTAIQQQTPQGQADLAAAEAQADLKKQEAAQKAKQMQSAQEGVQEVRDLAVTLLNHPGRKAATGTSSALWTRPGGDAYDFETSFERFESMLTVDNLDKMSGVLTDKDIQILKSAAAGLKLGMSEDAFESELNRVISKMNEKLGASQSQEFDASLLEFMSPEERALFE